MQAFARAPVAAHCPRAQADKSPACGGKRLSQGAQYPSVWHEQKKTWWQNSRTMRWMLAAQPTVSSLAKLGDSERLLPRHRRPQSCSL